MNAFRSRLLLACALLLVVRVAQAASFDCAQARSAVERMICGDATLSGLDEQLASAYRAAVSASPAAQQVRTEQRDWLARRNRCGEASCVREAYERRMSELSGGKAAPGAAPADPASPAVATGGKHCVFGAGNAYDMLLTREGSGGGLTFGFSSWTPEGHHFSVAGTARRAGPGWRHEAGMSSADPTERCAVTINRGADGTYRVATVEGARCEAYAGRNAVLHGTAVFPPTSRVGDAPGDFAGEALMRIGCDKPGRSGRPRR